MGNSQGKPVEFDGEVNLNHFRLLRVVGRGAFGKVRIVERKDTNLSFALKYIRKDEVVRSESVRNIIRERRMLEHVNHPFICNLRYSFQDIEYMYLVVDLMSGGDLRFHISRKTFTEEAVRFWIAELGCALRYVHGQGIIHRDVKPDNVLLDADGHVHLTDFNVASDIIPGKVLTSKSGTLAYLAPEVYAGRGYDVKADWWSLGVLFYECIYNKRPFEGNSESSLSQNIQAANPKYPITSPPVSLSCLYGIRDALEPVPERRMGATWESFTQHEFFACIDFEDLERKLIEPIFIPSSEKTNFDATYDLEELLLEEAPLEARARRQKPRGRLKDDATEKEIREEELYRMIERDFQPFDYTLAAYKKITEGGEAQPGAPQGTGPGMATNGPPQALTTDEATQMVNDPSSINRQASSSSQRSHRTAGSGGASGGASSRTRKQPPGRLPPLPPYPTAYTNAQSNGAGLNRTGLAGSAMVGSPTGGVQVTLDGAGSWSDLARQDATLPADAAGAGNDDANGGGGLGGVFGFLSRKKGRGNSPKPKERGVLGKEGARQVIG
ncbi:AGC/YANK protein kinase [Gaeumannomyces tritici R3-111a-1]|uniref:AGC/YANK protein kinase n=1 Tax=Gaeumannomyces tritici (strain R3-111a-1) TaxID=644352 RepID=J3NHX1_GAET3|nr:AGC/YANK protein kinase [Gaeumannomyces tritici R3-111a-1]EJT80864.1 AGC/YANK protein kinase [Gaeumannomyces tritici R3-111a-1]